MSRTIVNVFTGKCCRRRKVKPHKRFVFRWATGIQSFIEGKMARLTNEQQVSVTVAPKTAAGRPASIDGNVAWSSSDEAVCTVASSGPLTGLVVAVAPGVAQITAVFDADLDVGETREITMSGAVEVVAAEAETGEIVFGTPELTPLP
jgi:hypothetical protein